MTRRFKLAIALCGALAAMPALSGSTLAVDLVRQQATQNALQDAATLRALQNKIQRQRFQQQQQFYREIDRNSIVPQQQLQPNVPIMRQTCPRSSNGITACR